MTSLIESTRVVADKKDDRQATAWVVDVNFMSDEDITNEDIEAALEDAINQLGDSE